MYLQTGAGVGKPCDDVVRDILEQYVAHPPGARGAAWPDNPFDLGGLRETSGLEARWSEIAWEAQHTPEIAGVFVPMSCETHGVPPVDWAPQKERLEDPKFTTEQEILLADHGLQYVNLSRSERIAFINKWIASGGAFFRFAKRKETIQRSLRLRGNAQKIKAASAAALIAVNAAKHVQSAGAGTSATAVVLVHGADEPATAPGGGRLEALAEAMAKAVDDIALCATENASDDLFAHYFAVLLRRASQGRRAGDERGNGARQAARSSEKRETVQVNALATCQRRGGRQ